MDISTTVAAISGGASGLGAATAEILTLTGAKVILLDLDESTGHSKAEELGAKACFFPADVTDENSLKEAFSRGSMEFGTINAMINCAGIAAGERTLGKDGPHKAETFQKTIDINLVGSFNCARLASEIMQKNDPNQDGERGVIVHTASVAAIEGQTGQTAYSASKGGILGLTLPMARDLASLGIRVMAIAPGLFRTPMLEGLPEKVKDALSDQPLFPKRLGEPGEFGKLVQTIIENPYLNGSSIRLDGGVRLP